MLELYAKSNGESIREHTDKLLAAAEEFIEIYGSSFDEKLLLAVRNACEYHDYGKSVYVFQKMMKNNELISSLGDNKIKIESMYKEIGFEKNIPHGYLSPAFMRIKSLKEELGEELAMILISAVYYHHNRPVEVDASKLKRVINEDLKVRYPEIKISSKYNQYVLGNTIDDILWSKYAVVMGLLNRFDYYASDTDKDKLPLEIDYRYEQKTVRDFVVEYFENKKWEFRDVQRFALQNTDKNIIVIASTGIGKTEAALIWGGDTKLFYTLPLKVSINAMYNRIGNEYGYPKEKVTLLHSDALSYFIDEETDDEEMCQLRYEASRRLSYPVTVCTVDQLFTFVYKYRGCEQIFSSLIYSRIVVDEIQSYEPKIIAKLIYGLKLISDAGGKFAIITATMPPVLSYFISENNIPHAPQREFLITDKIRHRICYEEKDEFDYDLILKESSTKKVLIICNTVRRAIEVYSKIRNEYEYSNVKVLHSKFIRRHRKILEEEILKFAETPGEYGIRITTQIVEASLDIDFDVLFTEMCTADSLLQRMGRCYRKRDYSSASDPNIYILDNKNGYGTVYKYKEIYDRSVEFLRRYNGMFFSESSKMQYINSVYNTEELKETSYFKEIKDELINMKHIAPFVITKSESKDSFRGIEPNINVVPESLYNEYIDEFDECKDILTGKIKVGSSEKRNARNFVEDNSLTLSLYYDRRSKECSKSLLGNIGYYTLNYRYIFDEDMICGEGLIYDKSFDDMIL